MLKNILYILTFTVSLLFIFFLNGQIQLTPDPLPPFGKFLNPFGGAWTSNTLNEKIDFSDQIDGLKDPVEIIYDDRRVPHIFAQNMEDALFAQGYVEAQNRLFQLEFLARAAAGELSEVLGRKTIEYDRSKRLLGMKYAAENAIKGWEKHEDFKRFQRYVEGINAYIRQLKDEDLPLEFKLLNFKPSEWTPLKSALIFKEMSLTLAGHNNDIKNTNLLHILGEDDFNFLYPDKQTVETPVIPGHDFEFDSIYGKPFNAASIYPKVIKNTYFEKMPKGVGSNSWAVASHKSATGYPIFCNDPHLNLSLPSIWFELHIHTPEFNAYGVSFPGFPGIMIGFNEHIAWGETNVGQDVSDHFVVKWADSTRTQYILDGEVKDVTFRKEVIFVKGKETLIDTLKYTYWGPIQKSSISGDYDIALRWLPHDIPDTDEFNTFIKGMAAQNYNQYLEATEAYISPGQNFGFASKEGDIAMRINGRFPAKQTHDGRFLEWGNQSENNWHHWIPKYQNPQILNPERGFVSSANQVSAHKDYPYYFTGKFERYRNRIINDSLSLKSQFSVQDMKKMHVNNLSYKALDFLEMLKNYPRKASLPSDAKRIYENLIQWNGHYTSNSSEATTFDIFYDKLEKNTWDELEKLKDSIDIVLPEDWRLLELILQDPNNKYFDIVETPVVETALDIIQLALNETAQTIHERLSSGLVNEWGSYRPLSILHLLRLPAFSVEDLPAGGSPDAINAINLTYGPSWRMIVSLENKIKAYAVYPGGQSGNPSSQYYKNMIEPWLKGEYFELNNSNDIEDIKKSARQRITLTPKNGK